MKEGSDGWWWLVSGMASGWWWSVARSGADWSGADWSGTDSPIVEVKLRWRGRQSGSPGSPQCPRYVQFHSSGHFEWHGSGLVCRDCPRSMRLVTILVREVEVGEEEPPLISVDVGTLSRSRQTRGDPHSWVSFLWSPSFYINLKTVTAADGSSCCLSALLYSTKNGRMVNPH